MDPRSIVWPAGDPLKVFRLVGGLFLTPASAQSTVARSGRNAGGDAVAVRRRQHRRHRHSVGGAVARRRRQPRAAAGHPARLRRQQRDARAVEQSAECHARQPRDSSRSSARRPIADGKVFVATLSNKLVVYGLIGPSAGNAAPVVNAGADQNLPTIGTLTLTGTATDDGNPVPPGQLTTTWSLASGPGPVTFGTPNALSTTATFTVPGVYTIRLDRIRRRGDHERRRGRDGRSARRIGHGPAGAVLQRRRQRHLLHRARADAHGSDG